MLKRLSFAFKETASDLNAVLTIEQLNGIGVVFLLTMAGFVALQAIIDQDIFASILSGGVIATLFFFSVVGFIAIAGTLYDFFYKITDGREYNFEPRLRGWTHGWRISLSLALSGFVTTEVFLQFSEGVREIPVVGPQYASLLY